MNLLIAIPCFNEEQQIGRVLDLLPRAIPGVTAISVLVVDDGSADKTAEIARSRGATVIFHRRNLGVGRAFSTALDYGIQQGFDLMVNMDGDGQFDPDDIEKLIAPLIAGEADFVTGSRFIDATPLGIPRIKLWGNRRMANLINSIVGLDLKDVSCGFRAYTREALMNLNLVGDFTYTQESILELAYKNLRIKEVPIQVRYFSDRKSRVADSISRYALRTLKIILRSYRDFRPLGFFWKISGVLFLIGTAQAVFLAAHYLLTSQFSPYKVVGFASGFFIFLSIIFFIVGLMADMLDRIRIYQERILYLQKQQTFAEPQQTWRKIS